MTTTESIPVPEGPASAKPARSGIARERLPAAVAFLIRVAESAWFAYVSVALIQGKRLWDIWLYRDLTNGDTAAYFAGASEWARHLTLFDWRFSPLYQIFLGSFEWFISSTYDVIIVHRVVIALAASLLVLAVLRSLLPAGIAWVLAVWWAVLPINFDATYELHLFSILPTLGAVLIAARWKGGDIMRTVVFAILLVTTVLLRNEILVATICWILVWIGYEVGRSRERGSGWSIPVIGRSVRAARLPLGLAGASAAALAIFLIAQGSSPTGFQGKSSFTFCQIFATGARERGDVSPSTFSFNRPLACRGVMRETFGEPNPTWTSAIRDNPGAIVDHVLWNAHYIPYSLELMLFNEISGSSDQDPDYVPVNVESPGALVGLIAVGLLLLVGLTLLWRERQRWWNNLIRDRVWGWAALGCLSVAAVTVMLLQRPRPEYLYNFSVLLLAAIGVSAIVIGSKWPRFAVARAAIPIAAVAALIAIPSQYSPHYQTPQGGEGRPLLQMVDRLKPYAATLHDPATHLLAARFASDACIYASRRYCNRPTSLIQALSENPRSTSLGHLVKRLHINLIYADELILSNPSTRQFLERLERKGWRSLGPSPASGPWTLLSSPSLVTERSS
jgi:hypothetical protein